MLTPEQEKERRNYLGGSDAAAILGFSRFKSPLKVWAEKTGAVEPDDLSNKMPVILGNALEDTVAKLFSEATGKQVRRVNQTLFHPDHPFIAANIDRRVVGEDAIVECKTCNQFFAKEWASEEIPQEYILQVMHYLAVTGAKTAYLAVLIGNTEFKWKTIERDEDMVKEIIKREVHFWQNFIVPKIQPAVTRLDGETLEKMFTPVVEDEIALDDKAQQIVELLEASKQDRKNLEAQIDRMENELKAMLQDKAQGRTRTYIIKWPEIKTMRLDTTALKKEMPDIFAKFAKTTVARRFATTKIKQKEGENESN